MNARGKGLRPEILAPAGSEESFAAALSSGADAVYLGLAEGFNARARSTDFRLDGLADMTLRARRAGVKVYLTVNTLIFEDELGELEGLLRGALAAGVDALIVQDPATAFLAQRLCKDLRLHASTQMTISSAEGARFAATLGMTRVVLPRELSTREIALFTEQSPMECEVFVHGALCMAWSGQCLTSEAFSGRSANRGQCSQACRMPYEAIVDGKKLELGDVRYLLSPQDLAAHDALPALLEAGVHSLKIEGRYKGPAYVVAAVDSFRHWRDALLRGPTEEDRLQLRRDVERTQLTFSRGASLGFLGGDDHQKLVVATTPKHRGLPLGKVREVRARSVLVSPEPGVDATRVRAGLGVVFEAVGRSDQEHEPENAEGGPLFAVQNVGADLELGFGHPGPNLARVRVGDRLRLTGDPEIARDTQRRLNDGALGRLPLDLRVSGQEGSPLDVAATLRVGSRTLVAHAQSVSRLGRAKSGSGLDRALLGEKLGALGGTAFHLAELDTSALAPSLHAPVGELKGLRRQLVTALDAELSNSPYATPPAASQLEVLRAELGRQVGPLTSPPALVPLCRTEEQLEAVIEAGVAPGDEVELDWMEMVGLGRAVARAKAAGLTVTLATVRVQKPGEEAFDRRIENLLPAAVLVRHWGALMHFAEGARNSALRLHGDFSLNVTNSLTARHLLALGLETVTASHDLDQAQLLALLSEVPRGRVALTLHHHVPTFHDSHCVYAHVLSEGADYRSCGRPCEEHRLALRDYAGHDHPVVVDVSCRNTVFNAFAQSAAPLVPRLLELGVRRFRVEFVWEKGEDVSRTLAAYRGLLDGKLSPTAALEAAAVHERFGITTPLRLRKSAGR